MAAGPDKGNLFNPEAMLEMQRRNLEAFTSAGRIVAEGMRTAAERQTSMMQESMQDLWGEMQSFGKAPPTAQTPTAHLERMRTSFEKVMGQMQELSGLLIKVQSEALSVLNACAAANMEALKGLGPDAAAMHKAASDAVEQASAQAAAAVGELKKRMNDLEEATRAAANEPPAAEPPAAKAAPAQQQAAPKETPAAKAAPSKSQPKPAAGRARPSSGSRKS